MEILAAWCSIADSIVGLALVPLGSWILLSGLDDLFVDAMALLARQRRGSCLKRREVLAAPQKRIAVFVPCWHEAGVIARMVETNVARVRYTNYDIFVGAYPNDQPTIDAVLDLEVRYPHVHLSLCPNAGPTSKADCLNWIYQRMLRYEADTGVRFDIIVTHDAEDVIDADSLHWINASCREYQMVQIPVLPLPTPISRVTHGVYCDEFAEYQTRDMPVRQFMGAFMPSAGVGTGFLRDALEELAASEGNRIFEPACLTEDYENGLRLRLRGARQCFLPPDVHRVATREYFPQTLRSAVRQRTRWVTGIALQSWERHGWQGTAASRYWLWRDRKGLIGNPVSLLTNVLFGYGVATWAWSYATGVEWRLARELARSEWLMACTSAIGLYRMLYRSAVCGRYFGWRFATTAPARVLWGNLINTVATLGALWRFAGARWSGRALTWGKTEHEYPAEALAVRDRRRLGEVLVEGGYLTLSSVRSALRSKPAGIRLGEHLLALGAIDEAALYEALSAQHGLPQFAGAPGRVARNVARALPARAVREWKVVPFKVEGGCLYVGGPEVPSAAMQRAIEPLTRLRVRFHLMTPSEWRAMTEALL